MTDRHAGYIVVLAEDIREDDAEPTLAALRQIKGVLSVEPLVANPELHSAEQRIRHEYQMKLYEFVRSL